MLPWPVGSDETERALESEEVVEVDGDGTVHPPKPKPSKEKKTVLRDPKPEAAES